MISPRTFSSRRRSFLHLPSVPQRKNTSFHFFFLLEQLDRIDDRWERKHEKEVQIQDFIDYRYLGDLLQVSPDQKHAVFP